MYLPISMKLGICLRKTDHIIDVTFVNGRYATKLLMIPRIFLLIRHHELFYKENRMFMFNYVFKVQHNHTDD